MSLVVAGWRGVCRVRRFCQLVFVGACGRLGFLFVLLVWCLVCSARFGGARGALPHSSHSLRSSPFVTSLVVWDGMRLRYGVVLFLVSSLRPVLASRLSCRRWRLVPPPRVGVSCRRVDVCVLCRRASRVGVVLSRRFCQLGFPCRLVFTLSLRLLFSCSFRRACRMAACS